MVSDLHLGWEKLLSQRGVHVPSQTPKIKKTLIKSIKKSKASNLILLGDVKDAITKVSIEEWNDIPEFFEDVNKEVGEAITENFSNVDFEDLEDNKDS